MPEPEPLVTVVIPARNEEDYIGACLASITSQTYRNLDIIVVDGSSIDKTVDVVEDVVKADPRVRLVPNPDMIIPAGLNVALREARGEWVVRVDAHATVPPDYVARAVQHLKTGKWGGVGGRKDGVGLSSAGRAIAAAMASPFGVGGSTYHHGTSVRSVEHIPFGAYPTVLARAIGGWDERLRVNQDFEFDWRIRQAGHELLFDPALRIDWICRQSTRELLSQYVRYGRGKARVAAMHPRSLSLRHLVPPLFVVYLGLTVVLALFRPFAAALAVTPYLVFLLVATFATARRLRPAEAVHVPFALMAMHLGWGYGFLRGCADWLRRRW